MLVGMSALALADPIPPSHDNYLLCKLCEATVQVVAPLADKKLPEIEEVSSFTLDGLVLLNTICVPVKSSSQHALTLGKLSGKDL